MRDLAALDEARLTVRLAPCPHCARTGLVIGHGMLWGYAEGAGVRVVRGRRFLCSRRGRKNGCGHTFAIRISEVIPNFVVRATTLSRLLLGVEAGHNRKAAWEQLDVGMCLRSVYRLWARLVQAQPHVRTSLSARAPPPDCADARPVAQLAQHLRGVLGSNGCVLSGFQLHFQQSIFGR